MTQATTQIGANQSGLQYRNADNDGKKALLNHHKGSTAPSYAEAGIIWLDDTATPWILKMYDGADWIVLATINASTNAVEAYHGAAALRLLNYATDTGSANAYAVAPAPAITAYTTGQIVTLKPANASTGAATLNVNSLGTKNIKTLAGADPASGALATTGVYQLVYDGTNFVLLNPSLGSAAYLTAGTAANNLVQLDGSARLPAVDGSQLTGLASEMVLLSTATASSSSTISFTSLISSYYDLYYFVFEKVLQSTTASVQMKFSTDNGSTWTANINWQKHEMQLASATTPTLTGGSSPALLMTSNANENNSGHGFLEVSSGAAASWHSYICDNDGVYCKCYASSGAVTTVNAIQFLPSAGNFTSGKIYMYGIKNT